MGEESSAALVPTGSPSGTSCYAIAYQPPPTPLWGVPQSTRDRQAGTPYGYDVLREGRLG